MNGSKKRNKGSVVSICVVVMVMMSGWVSGRHGVERANSGVSERWMDVWKRRGFFLFVKTELRCLLSG
jgi:hypothetical protein